MFCSFLFLSELAGSPIHSLKSSGEPFYTRALQQSRLVPCNLLLRNCVVGSKLLRKWNLSNFCLNLFWGRHQRALCEESKENIWKSSQVILKRKSSSVHWVILGYWTVLDALASLDITHVSLVSIVTHIILESFGNIWQLLGTVGAFCTFLATFCLQLSSCQCAILSPSPLVICQFF